MDRDQIQAHALPIALQHKRCGLALSMGAGKTLLGLKYIDALEGNFLVVYPNVPIKTSWIADAEKFNLEHVLKRITFTTYLSLNKQDPTKYAGVVLDEAHSTKFKHYTFLNKFTGRVLGLTGTPPRYTNSERGIMMTTFYPLVFTYLTDNMVESEILNDYQINVITLPLDTRINYKTKTYTTSEQKQYLWLEKKLEEHIGTQQEMFWRLRLISALKTFNTKELAVKQMIKEIPFKCLVFANTIAQAESLCQHTVHSKNKNSEVNLDLFKQGEITKLAAVEQLSMGVNIPNLRSIIVMHTYGNERRFAQKLGRALRLNPKEKSTVWVLTYSNTADMRWTLQALKDFDSNKIRYGNFLDYDFKALHG